MPDPTVFEIYFNKIDSYEQQINDLFENANESLKKIKHFNSVADMKADTTLLNTYYVKTLGYYEANDGGGANYLIREATENDVEDNGAIHILNNGLVAELIIDNVLNIKQLGCKENDENFDNIPLINKGTKFMYEKKEGGKVFIPKGTFYCKPNLGFIYIQPNTTYFGLGDVSILKVASNTGLYSKIFGDYLRENVNDPIQNNVIFKDFCIDGNLENNTINEVPSDSSTSMIAINTGRNNVNCRIEDMTIYTNGIWAIIMHGQNSIIKNNKIYFKQKYISTFYDVSSICFEGNNFVVENNLIEALEDTILVPNTAIECHGNNNRILNNHCLKYNTGVITIPLQLGTCGVNGNDNIVAQNRIVAKNIGISIWKGKSGECKRNKYINNQIFMLSGGKQGIYFTYENEGSIACEDIEILNNTITFYERIINENPISGYNGISCCNVNKIKNCTIENNVINECGGNGIVLKLYNSGDFADLEHENIYIKNNILNNVYVPFSLSTGIKNVVITDNIIYQEEAFETIGDNMKTALNSDGGNAKNFTFKNNKVITPKTLKPFYPRINANNLGAAIDFRETKNIFLEENNSSNEIPFIYKLDYTQKAKNIQYGNYYNDNGTLKKSQGATLGTLKTNEGNDVVITEWVSNTHIVVNDATNIYPENIIGLSDKFNNSYVPVSHVIGNHVFINGNLIVNFSLKSNYTASDVINEVVDFRAYSTNV